ncbi:MAG: hypothetical protein M3N24_06235 [Actinomycetota bacterium]|nr:hypothetical protein [Actinomycetota bacterium]
MARASRKPSGRIRRSPAYRVVERSVLSIGMGVVAFFIERRLIKAIRSGGVKPAPRTLAEREDYDPAGPSGSHEGTLSSSYPPSAG